MNRLKKQQIPQFGQSYQLAKVMDGRIDPSAALGEQNTPPVGCNGMCNRAWRKLHLERREMLHDERRQILTSAKVQQVLLVQCIDDAFAIASMIRFEMIIGRPLSAVQIRYIEKHPGKHVTEPNSDSNALAVQATSRFSESGADRADGQREPRSPDSGRTVSASTMEMHS